MTIEQRLQKLERSNRRWRVLAVVALVAVVLVSCGRDTATLPDRANAESASDDKVHDVLKTRRLEIIDENGRAAGAFAGPDSGATLAIYSADRKAYTILGAVNGKMGFSIKYGGKSTSIEAGNVRVLNSAGKIVATLQVNKKNEGMVSVHDFSGEPKNFLVVP